MARAQFQKEARAAARLSHPAIVGIVDFGEHDGTLFYVMEYVAGGTLDAHTERDTLLPVDRVVELIFKCTRALDFASQHGITHRDLQGCAFAVDDRHVHVAGAADDPAIDRVACGPARLPVLHRAAT